MNEIEKPKYHSPMTCADCGRPLQCMPGGGGLADFECPNCYPPGFRPLSMTLEEWHRLHPSTEKHK